MAGTGQHVAYPIAFDGFNLTQHGGFSLAPNVQFSDIHVAGRARRIAVIADSMSPVYSIASPNLTSLLGQMSLKRPLAQANGASFYGQQREENDTYASGSNHVKFLTRKGALLINRVSVSGTSPASATMEYHELWDGTNDMSVVTASESLGAASPAFVSQFYRGSVLADGAAFANVEGWDLDTGMAINKPLFGGDIGPRKLSVETVDPVIDIACASLSDWPGKSIKVYGKKIATSLQLYLKKGDEASARGGSGTALLISSAEGHVTPSRVDLNGLADGMCHFLFRPTDELAFNLAATHP